MKGELLEILQQNLLWEQCCGGLSQEEYELYISLIDLVVNLPQNELENVFENTKGATTLQNPENTAKSKLAQWILRKRVKSQKRNKDPP